jgi:hypothetical protein
MANTSSTLRRSPSATIKLQSALTRPTHTGEVSGGQRRFSTPEKAASLHSTQQYFRQVRPSRTGRPQRKQALFTDASTDAIVRNSGTGMP